MAYFEKAVAYFENRQIDFSARKEIVNIYLYLKIINYLRTLKQKKHKTYNIEMKRLLIILALTLCVLPASAQQRSKITATVVDIKSGAGVPGAVVELASTANPDSKKYYTTGYGGKVEIANVAYGNYKMVITFLGYADFTKEFKVSSATLNLGKLQLEEASTRIDMVVKEAKALRTSQDGDTLSYNAGAFKVTTDADVEGLLKKMPGITIQNGEVSAQGETVKKVYVDGKEFFGEDVNTAIKSLPAQAVDRIEVYNKLSDQAEFSGMDDGEGFKAINIVTHRNMRQGQFGKMYAGYGYQPQTDDITSHHKYTVGGNVNVFQNDSRLSVIGLFNNINQQNFSFEDILGVSGAQGGGGRRRGVGQYMVRPQAGVALVNSIGLNYSDQWGKKDQVKFQSSYFFNNTYTKNLSEQETWYESPSPIDTLFKSGSTRSLNNNHRFNARVDWKISRSQSLMSRTYLSYQGNNNPKFGNTSNGFKYGQSGLTYIDDATKRNSYGIYFNEFLQYRLRIGEKVGRTLSVSGRFNLRDNHNLRRVRSNNADAIEEGTPEYEAYMEELRATGSIANINSTSLYNPLCQYIEAPSRTYNVGGTLEYNEPLGKVTALSFQYRFSYEDEEKNQQAWITDDKFDKDAGTINSDMTQDYRSGYWTHRVGPGFRYSKKKNTFVANVYYQYSSLDGNIAGVSAERSDKIKKSYHDVLYFAMLNYMFNKENSIRLFFRSYTDNPSVTQLQNIYDVSTPQYLSIGNKDLRPSFTHRINFHYINSNVEKGRTFMWMFMMQNQQNYLSQSTLYNREGFELPIGDKVYRPQQVTSYENMDGYWNLRTHLSLGLPMSFMKCNLNIMAGVNYIVNPSAVYGSLQDMYDHKFTKNYANNIGYDAQVTLGSNISEKIDFTLTWNGAFNQAWNTAAGKVNGKYQMNNYFNHSATGTLKWVFWKGFTFTAACSYVQYLGFTNKYNEDYVLCNLYLGKKLFRNQLGEVQIGVNDVANQNTAFVRSTGSGYTQNLTNSVIGRYFSIQFVYNLRHFGKKGSTNMKDYDYRESRSGVGVNGAGGMRRPMGPPMRR